MKMGYTPELVKNTGIIGLLLIMAACSGCGSEPKDPFAHVRFNPYSDGLNKRVEVYNTTTSNDAVTP